MRRGLGQDGRPVKAKEEKRAHFEAAAPSRDARRRKSAYHHRFLDDLLAFLVPQGASVLELGRGTGDLLAGLRPSLGVGPDLSPRTIELARARYPASARPELEWVVGNAQAPPPEGTFDFVVLSDLVGELTDAWAALRALRRVTTSARASSSPSTTRSGSRCCAPASGSAWPCRGTSGTGSIGTTWPASSSSTASRRCARGATRPSPRTCRSPPPS